MPFSGAFGVEHLSGFKWDRLQRSIVVLEMPLLSSSEFLSVITLFANRRTFDHFGCEWSYHAIGSSSFLILLANSFHRANNAR
jgi:hypothetical protein